MKVHQILITCLFLLVMLAVCLPCSLAEDSMFDLDAMQEYCDKWGVYYDQAGINLTFNLTPSLDGASLSLFTYFDKDIRNEGVKSSAADLLTNWNNSSTFAMTHHCNKYLNYYSIVFFPSDMSEMPESLYIQSSNGKYHGKPGSTNSATYRSFQFDPDVITDLSFSTLLTTFKSTIHITSDKRSSSVEISKDNPEKFALMLHHLVKCFSYSRKDSDFYLSASSLPPTSLPSPTPKPTATPKPTPTPKYAFDNVPYAASKGTNLSPLLKDKYDDSGAVYAIKCRLYEIGYLASDDVNGYYDDAITTAIQEFRDKNNLSPDNKFSSVMLIDRGTLSKLYDDNAKKGDLYKPAKSSSSNSSSGSSSSKSSSSKSGGHWEWQWKTVWVYRNCYCGHDRHCALCWGTGTYQSPQKQKQKVWVSD